MSGRRFGGLRDVGIVPTAEAMPVKLDQAINAVTGKRRQK
jgi:hypothetical protein